MKNQTWFILTQIIVRPDLDEPVVLSFTHPTEEQRRIQFSNNLRKFKSAGGKITMQTENETRIDIENQTWIFQTSKLEL